MMHKCSEEKYMSFSAKNLESKMTAAALPAVADNEEEKSHTVKRKAGTCFIASAYCRHTNFQQALTQRSVAEWAWLFLLLAPDREAWQYK